MRVQTNDQDDTEPRVGGQTSETSPCQHFIVIILCTHKGTVRQYSAVNRHLLMEGRNL